MARSNHSNLSGADRFERRARRGHKPTTRRASTRRQAVALATEGVRY